MLEDIRRELKKNVGLRIEIETKGMHKLCGVLNWISPDRTMAELTLKDGSIKTLLDIHIKRIKTS